MDTPTTLTTTTPTVMSQTTPTIQVTVPPPVIPPTPIISDPTNPQTLPPTTTLQEDATTAGQRRINLIWEITQAMIALMITGAIIYTAITKSPAEVITNSFFLIVGFYFSRTNHAAIGGVGSQPTVPYAGR
jgi:hypothetical protein